MTAVVGVDLGTTGGKAVLVNEHGEVLGTAWREYPMHRPHAGWAENDPDDWVRAAEGMVRDVVAGSGVDPASVKAVSFVAQRDPVVLIDDAGEVLTPSISWLDRRDPEETDGLFREFGRKHLTAVSGVVPVPALTLPNLVWTRRHLPAIWERARHALFVKDYVIYRLTGEIATDVSTLSRSLLNDYRANDWSSETCAARPLRPVGGAGDAGPGRGRPARPVCRDHAQRRRRRRPGGCSRLGRGRGR